jgi:hypothetical protein
MKTVSEITQKVTGLVVMSLAGMLVFGSCSTVREQGEPDVKYTTVITTDEQRKVIYDRGGTASPQQANPIPTSEQLGLDEKASEINRKRNIEDGNDNNAPANSPTEERPRQLRNVGNDTIVR